MGRIDDKGRPRHRYALCVFAAFLCISNMPTFARSSGRDRVALRIDGPAVDPKAAKRLSPDAVGDLLLAPGHPPVTEVRIGPEFMVPYPPGVKIPERFELHLRPVRSREAGFCERVIAIVHVKAVDRLADGTIPPSRPEKLAIRTSYQWAGKARRPAKGCGDPKAGFFVPDQKGKAEALDAVRLLAKARMIAMRTGRLASPTSIDDVLGPEWLKYEQEHPEEDRMEGLEILTDARKALSSVPMTHVESVRSAYPGYAQALSADDIDKAGPSSRAVSIFAFNEWNIGMIISQGRIALLRIKRAFPPPF